MMKLLPTLLMFISLVSIPIETSAADTAAGTQPLQPSLLIRTWQKVAIPWSPFSAAPPAVAPTRVNTTPPATQPSVACQCSAPTTSHPLLTTMANLARVRDALYYYADSAYEYFKPPQGNVGTQWGKQCAMFIQADGSYGTYGMAMQQSISPVTHPNLFSATIARDMAQICPAFSKWNDQKGVEQKKAFLVWVAASVAQAESSCQQSVPEKRGPGGILKGIFQLAKNQEDSFPINAPPLSHCSRGASLTATGSGVCFFKMLDFDVGVHHDIFSSPRDPDRYFQSLFTGPAGEKVRSRLKLYQPCRHSS